mmetsp:Transcript_20771/g.47577  ORF Transcript_20771/g.47577 Transcript_20771/m.47577 type:complete len:125 (+) Transcript_20771:79-453(+)
MCQFARELDPSAEVAQNTATYLSEMEQRKAYSCELRLSCDSCLSWEHRCWNDDAPEKCVVHFYRLIVSAANSLELQERLARNIEFTISVSSHQERHDREAWRSCRSSDPVYVRTYVVYRSIPVQ